MDPFISIITVALNAAESIEDTLASVSGQQVNFPVEHLCIDGGSRDGTREAIDRWAAMFPSVRRIYEPDKGIFDAMNKGLGAARGEYVLFLNSDDFLVSPTTLADAMNGLAPCSDTNPDLILGDVVMGALGIIGIWRHRRVPRRLARLPGWGLFPVHQGVFAKRRLLEAVGGLDAGLKLGSDVIQYYHLECQFHPSIRLLHFDVSLMRAGGAANANLRAMCLGSAEIYRHLAANKGRARATWMVCVKTMQSLSELRLGRCPHSRWFADPGLRARAHMPER